jgi:hypothetical protein
LARLSVEAEAAALNVADQRSLDVREQRKDGKYL